MLGFMLVSTSADPAVTPEVLSTMAGALSQFMLVVADGWQRTPILVGTSESAASVPAGFTSVLIQDTLDAPGDLAYHDVDASGRPRIFVGWSVIKNNGGTLLGPDGLLATTGHELAEAFVDPYCGFWTDMPGSLIETAVEVCDPLQGEDFELDQGSGLFVPNFCLPRYYSAGVGPYDYRQQCSGPFALNRGGYQIRRQGGPQGKVSDVFGAEPHEGGMPQWKRDAKLGQGTRRTRRHDSQPAAVV